MNGKKFLRGVAMLVTASLIFVSCQKENFEQKDLTTGENGNIQLSGVVPEDESLVAKVPVITSADYLADNIPDYFLFQNNAKPAGGRDRTSPNVSINNPLTGTTVNGNVPVQVSASDNVAVASVQLKLNGTTIGTLTTGPYNFTLNTTGLAAGTHQLSATATDAAGNTKTHTIQVGYSTPAGTDITPPSVTITSPANGAAVSSTVSVTASASDNVGVTLVNFKVNGATVASDNTAPYSFSWNTATVASGINTITAEATDAAGNSNAHSIQVTVNTTVVTPPVTLPSSFQLYMPPVSHQGGEGSCVAFSVGYAARSVEQYYKTGATSYSFASNIFSPEFLYNQTKITDCASGTGVSTALNFLINTGISTWESMPYSSYNGCAQMPTAAQLAEAANYKITGYSRIPVADVTAMKTMLTQKHALVINIAIDQSFSLAQPGFIWSSYSGNPGISHSLVICGYDDSKHAYKVMNSWGTTWADAGYSWINYDFLPQAAYYYAYVIN